MAFFGITVNFIINFLWCQVFLREREKIFYTYFGPKSPFKILINQFDHRSKMHIFWYKIFQIPVGKATKDCKIPCQKSIEYFKNIRLLEQFILLAFSGYFIV